MLVDSSNYAGIVVEASAHYAGQDQRQFSRTVSVTACITTIHIGYLDKHGRLGRHLLAR